MCRALVEQDARVHLVLRVMGLSHAADTLVGDNLLRGVSGGCGMPSACLH